MKNIKAKLLLAAAIFPFGFSPPSAQETRVMPLEQVKQILDVTRNSWIAFRNFDGRQLIYFTQIISWHCGIAKIRYSLNSGDLDKAFPVPKCNPLLPNNIGQDDKIHLQEALGTVDTISVQIVFDDQSASDIHTYGACPGAGETTCGQLLETRKASQ